MRQLVTYVEHIAMTIISQKRNDLLDSLLVSSIVLMKLTISTFGTGGNLLGTNLVFVFVQFMSLKSDMNDGLD